MKKNKKTPRTRQTFTTEMKGTIRVPFNSPLEGLLVLALNKQKAVTLKGVHILSSQTSIGIDARFFDLSIDTGELLQ